ncbi:MAG: hypothetical protein K2G70_00525 [Turicibacter sp.]|nr:hypothetical protein [Turicibacter sp.]
MKKFLIYVISIVVIISLFFLYSFQVLKYSIKVDETIIKSPSIPSSFDGTRFIQFSDLYLKNEEDLKILKLAVEEINRLEADIVLFTGNLFEEGAITSTLRSQVIEILSQLNSSLAKLAILGDQDLIQSNDISDIFAETSFKLLRNESLEIYNGSSEGVNFIGIDSLETSPDLDTLLLQFAQPNKFNILLIHEPTLAAKTVDYPIELQLSGHCRGLSSTSGCTQFYAGTYRFADQLTLQVNQGLNRLNQFSTLLNRPTLHSFLLIKQ